MSGSAVHCLTDVGTRGRSGDDDDEGYNNLKNLGQEFHRSVGIGGKKMYINKKKLDKAKI